MRAGRGFELTPCRECGGRGTAHELGCRAIVVLRELQFRPALGRHGEDKLRTRLGWTRDTMRYTYYADMPRLLTSLAKRGLVIYWKRMNDDAYCDLRITIRGRRFMHARDAAGRALVEEMV